MTRGEVHMELQYCLYHECSESILFEMGLGKAYSEARETVLATPVKLATNREQNNLRVIRDCMQKELAGRGWEINARIFPSSAPKRFERGRYCLDASKHAETGAALGAIWHFGGSEFIVRQLMLISEAVRRNIIDCGLLALMTREVKPYVSGRPAFFDQAQRLLRTYGQSGFRGVPIILWGLMPEALYPKFIDGDARLPAGKR